MWDHIRATVIESLWSVLIASAVLGAVYLYFAAKRWQASRPQPQPDAARQAALEAQRQAFVERQQRALEAQAQAAREAQQREKHEQKEKRLAALDAKAQSYGMQHITRSRKLGTTEDKGGAAGNLWLH